MRKSNVIVNILDLSSVKERLFGKYIQQNGKDTNLMGIVDNGPWGVVYTKKGMFLLNSMGTGNIDPLSNNSANVISFYPVFEDESISFNNPVVLGITLDFVQQLDRNEKKNLSNFIVKFLPVHEENFKFWNEFFKNKIIKDENTDENTEFDLEDEIEGVDKVDEVESEEKTIREKHKEKKKNKTPLGNKIEKTKKVLKEKNSKQVKDYPLISNEESLVKYNKFLVNIPCSGKKIPLVEITDEICCPCGKEFEKHIHCKCCGGII